MKAMIFAAGLGTRLRPLTDTMPKALVKVDGTPMLEIVIRNLIKYGFDEVIVNVHHFGQQIIDFLSANKNFGITIHVSDERDELLDTGGGVLKAREWLDSGEPFLIHNADILTDLNLREIYDYHLHHNADVTLLAAERDTSRYLVCDSDNRMCGWTNIKTGEIKPADLNIDSGKYHNLAYGCVEVVSNTIFSKLESFSTEHKFSIIPFYVTECKDLKIMCYTTTGYSWFDIGTAEKLATAEKWLRTKQHNGRKTI